MCINEVIMYLRNFQLTELREVARHLGVKVPSHFNRRALIEEIMMLLNGEKEPYIKGARGRPVKCSQAMHEQCIRIIENLSRIKNREVEIVPQHTYVNIDEETEKYKKIIGVETDKQLLLYLIKRLI